MLNEFIEGKIKKMYVINLKNRHDRYSEFIKKISKYFNNKLIEKFDAIDGKLLDLNLIKESYLKKGNKMGEIGCHLSHRNIWKLIADDDSINNNDLCMIFEDDIFFTTINFDIHFKNAIESFLKI
jgi:glycosyl transferase family 25